ncbi:MAG: ATP-binding protein [Clostridia bacterium]|nr:ATP-binding protein [Clostridia bacterium]
MIKKIVITGGPCGGKTSAMKRLSEAFTEMGYTVIIIPETATELINAGISAKALGSALKFQKCVTALQLEKEKVYFMGAQALKREKVLLLLDRGLADSRAYLTDGEYEELLGFFGKSRGEFVFPYEAVFHMTTAADGAEEFYTTSNNTARTEEPPEARELDKKIIDAWSGHENFYIIDNSTDFKGKIARLVEKASELLE